MSKEYAPVFTDLAKQNTFIVLANSYFTKTETEAEELGEATLKIFDFLYVEVIEIENRQLYHHAGTMNSLKLGYLSGVLFDEAEIRSKRGR